MNGVETPQTIVSLEVENVLRLNAVVIEPKGNTVIIGGANEQGKSSLLDAIEMLFAGDRSVPADPIHHGAEKGHIIGETQDLIVSRRFTQKNPRGYIKVEAKDGSELIGSPQKILDSLWSSFTFDPLAFMAMKPADRLDELKKLMGLDFTALDAEHAEIYQKRTAVNAQYKVLQTELKGLPEAADAPDEEVDVARVMAELEAAQAHNRDIAYKGDQVDALCTDLENQREELERARAQVLELEERIEKFEAAIATAKGAFSEMVAADTVTLSTQITEAGAINDLVRAKKAKAEKSAKARLVKREADNLTADLTDIQEEKARELAACKCPVPGMTITEDAILLDDVLLEQASQAQMLRVSVNMGFARNPLLKILLVRTASLLDEKSMALVAQLAEEAGGQLFLERVGKGEEAQIIIEDGRVLEKAA